MAGTVIDNLVVVLSLDTSKFTPEQKKALDELRKTKDAAKAHANGVEAASKKASEGFGQVLNSVLRLTAAYIGLKSIKSFAEDTTAAVAAQGRLAQSIGSTTREVGLWEQAVRLFGGSGEAAGQTLHNLSQSLAELQVTGQSPIVPWLNKLLGPQGWLDAEGHVKSFTQLLLDLSKAVTSGQYTPAQANFFLRQIGLDQDTINLLLQGTDAVQKFLDTAKKAGVPNEAQSRELQKLQTSWENFGQTLATVGRDLLTHAAPNIEQALNWISRSVTDARTAIERAIGDNTLESGARKAASPLLVPLLGRIFGLTPRSDRVGASGLSLFDLIQQLENSGPSAVSSAGAIGRNQIKPSTAEQYGFDSSRLDDPAYNDIVARAIEADLARRYHGDTDAIAIAYNAGPRVADRWMANGRNNLTLPQETQQYLAHERALTGGGGNATTVTINGNIIVNTRATDPDGVARAVGNALSTGTLVTPANQGPQ